MTAPLLLTDERPKASKEARALDVRVQKLVNRVANARDKLDAKDPMGGWYWSCELIHARDQLAAIHSEFPRLVVPHG